MFSGAHCFCEAEKGLPVRWKRGLEQNALEIAFAGRTMERGRGWERERN